MDGNKNNGAGLFGIIALGIIAIMYMVAFHQMRDENKILKEKLSKYEKTH
jgi:hypothetical protein